MRLLHCICTLDPAGGGPIEALRQRVLALAALGHCSEVACLDSPDASWLKRDFPASVHALGPGRLGIYRYSAQWSPWIAANCARFDAVIVNGLWQYNGWGTLRALPPGFPYFVFPHGMLDPWFKRTYPLKHLKKWLYWPWADYRMLKNARAVFFTSESERSLARESFWLYRCTEQVVNYGTAGPVGDPHALREVFLQHYPKARGKKVLLFLGRIHPKKGPDLLLRALAVALSSRGTDQGKNVHVVMAGPNDNIYGQQMARLSSSLGLNERVTWTGMLTGDMKWGAYFAADAFTLPSHQENFGVSVAEALACSLPVLISNQVNIWREIEADGAGFVEADDVVGTKNLLDRWLQTPETDWMAMRARARGCYQARFAVAQAAESLARALTEFGAGRRR